jgi:cbb3-type cytochrome oxidase maturation protein
MYYPYFLTYIIIGIFISLLVFSWALRTGQFKDQDRARFLPLEDEPVAGPVKIPVIRSYEMVALILLALAGLIVTAAVLMFSLFGAKG